MARLWWHSVYEKYKKLAIEMNAWDRCLASFQKYGKGRLPGLYPPMNWQVRVGVVASGPLLRCAALQMSHELMKQPRASIESAA